MVQTLTLNLPKFVKLLYSKYTYENLSLDMPVDIATTWAAGVRFPAGTKIFLYSTASRLLLGPTQPPNQWETGVKWLGVEVTTHHLLLPNSINVELHLHSHIHFHGVVLN
jgi:hypothetical protein